jgi:protein-disulfide isomerase
MMKVNRRAMIAMAAAMAAGPVFGQEATAPEIKDFSIGNPDAPVKMVEYASFTCPHCGQFHTDVFKKLKTEYIDTGKVHFTLREVYFDRYGLWAAMMARCGGDLKYFGIADILFSTQVDWAGTDDPTVAVGNIKTIGLAAAMTSEQLDVCMQDAAMAEALVKRFEENMKADGVEGTPTLFINGDKHGNMAYEDLKVILDGKLAG